MFKKAIEVKQKHKIGNNAKKKLKNEMKKIFDDPSVEDMFESIKDMNVGKISSSKILIYSDDDGTPMIIDLDGRNTLIPTLYAIQRHRKVSKVIKTYPKVESFIFKGANLMWPGVSTCSNELENLRTNEVVYLEIEDNNVNNEGLIYGVGRMGDMEGERKTKGIAVYVLHYWGDMLTRLGDMRMRDGGVEREGNEEGGHEGEDQDTNIEIMESKSMDVQEGEIGSENIVDQLPIMEIPENKLEENRNECLEMTKEEESKEFIEENKLTEDIGEENENQIPSQVEMNELLLDCFLTALKISLKEDHLPMEPSTLSRHMSQCNSSDIPINLKYSSYKKLGKFLTEMAKEGFIDYKESKKGSKDHPLICRLHPEKYEDFRPRIRKPNKIIKANTEEEKDPRAPKDEYPKVIINEFYKPTKALRAIPIFDKLIKQGAYKSYDDWRNIFIHHLQERELFNPQENKNIISVSPDLVSAFSLGEGPKEFGAKWELPLSDIIKKLKTKFTIVYEMQYLVDIGQKKNTKIITQNNLVEITAEKSFNKNVTRISGLDTYFLVNLEEFTSNIRKQYSASATIHPAKFVAGNEVLIQGNQAFKIFNDITNPEGYYKINKKFVVVNDKLSLKKKKK